MRPPIIIRSVIRDIVKGMGYPEVFGIEGRRLALQWPPKETDDGPIFGSFEVFWRGVDYIDIPTELTGPCSVAKLARHMAWKAAPSLIYRDLSKSGLKSCPITNFVPETSERNDEAIQFVDPRSGCRPEVERVRPPPIGLILSCPRDAVVVRCGRA